MWRSPWILILAVFPIVGISLPLVEVARAGDPIDTWSDAATWAAYVVPLIATAALVYHRGFSWAAAVLALMGTVLVTGFLFAVVVIPAAFPDGLGP